jgi:hypothetical protein
VTGRCHLKPLGYSLQHVGLRWSRLRNLYLSLENTDQQFNRDLAVHILISRLPDCYKSEGQAAKQQNLSFVATAAYLLANVKDSSTFGDNLSGQALVAQDLQQLRDGEHFSRTSRRGSSRSNGRNFSSRDIPCNWCKRRGHRERDCWTKQRQISSGEARVNKRGKAYMAKRVPVPSQPFTQVPMYSPNPSVGTQYPQNPPASFNANSVPPTWHDTEFPLSGTYQASSSTLCWCCDAIICGSKAVRYVDGALECDSSDWNFCVPSTFDSLMTTCNRKCSHHLRHPPYYAPCRPPHRPPRRPSRRLETNLSHRSRYRLGCSGWLILMIYTTACQRLMIWR